MEERAKATVYYVSSSSSLICMLRRAKYTTQHIDFQRVFDRIVRIYFSRMSAVCVCLSRNRWQCLPTVRFKPCSTLFIPNTYYSQFSSYIAYTLCYAPKCLLPPLYWRQARRRRLLLFLTERKLRVYDHNVYKLLKTLARVSLSLTFTLRIETNSN